VGHAAGVGQQTVSHSLGAIEGDVGVSEDAAVKKLANQKDNIPGELALDFSNGHATILGTSQHEGTDPDMLLQHLGAEFTSGRQLAGHVGSSQTCGKTLSMAAICCCKALGVKVSDPVNRGVPKLRHGKVHQALRAPLGVGCIQAQTVLLQQAIQHPVLEEDQVLPPVFRGAFDDGGQIVIPRAYIDGARGQPISCHRLATLQDHISTRQVHGCQCLAHTSSPDDGSRDDLSSNCHHAHSTGHSDQWACLST